MDLLMAIALLCQVPVGNSRGAADAHQLRCQQDYLKCYLEYESKEIVIGPALPLDSESARKRYLYQCVMDRRISTPACDTYSNPGGPSNGTKL